MIQRRAKTPLFAMLQKCMREAQALNARQMPRRDFLRGVAAGGAALAATPLLQACSSSVEHDFSQTPRIAVVGAGLAGLTAAHYLKKSGLHADIYDANSRAGGRCYTASGLMGPGLTTELGGEFLDTIHEDILALVGEFGLELFDYRSPPESNFTEAFFFDGELRYQANVVSEFRLLAPIIERDMISLEDEGPAGTAAFEALDALSISAYFDSIGASGWIRSLLEVAYCTEYGLEVDNQSSLNLLYLISADTSGGRFEVFGESDERFKVRGGNELIARSLADGLQDQIKLDYRLERLSMSGESYVLDFQVGGSARSFEADFVIMAIPFSTLRSVDLALELPPEKLTAIRELGYGTNSKLFLGFSSRVWRNGNLSGNFFADLGSQSGWDNSRSQPGSRGSITIYSGGNIGADADKRSIADAARSSVRDLERFMPGAMRTFTGEAHRFHWPTNPFTLGSYAAYKVGQWTGISGNEITPVGRLLFAGEHCSVDFQGYLNGAVQTGRMASEELIAQLTRSQRPAALRRLPPALN